jgi:hypothetical protein
LSSDLEKLFAPLGFELVVSIMSQSHKVLNTVGGTSFAAFRPGFFRGGRTQVLLKAPFEITFVRMSLEAAGEGGTASGLLEKEGRGARGVTSDGFLCGSREVKTDIAQEMWVRV